ncbi:radical SAM protein [Desulfogranum marinum]|uniref:radical SAM protein n=1 Tax=Desulfogranum marinum TaxID=453220 RepID=UPI0029C91CEF|nr:radical SAM protein [Desulfogranum marinum]
MTTRSQTLFASGQLQQRADQAHALLNRCTLCPRKCAVNRLKGEHGLCKTGEKALVASYGPHFGEEQPLVGSKGSGTIFFAGCSLLCCFCQNFDISHTTDGSQAVDDQALAAIMIELQNRGCHNINLVTPSHVVPQILAALVHASANGLQIPIVYNCSGYDSVETLALLDGVIDIYMPDFKFWEIATSNRWAKAPDYPQRARESLRSMHQQVGDLQINDQGLATSGLLVRHLLMPGKEQETEEILAFIANQISRNTYVNIMDQYHPCGDTTHFPELQHTITTKHYHQALAAAHALGLHRLDQRDLSDLLRNLIFQQK